MHAHICVLNQVHGQLIPAEINCQGGCDSNQRDQNKGTSLSVGKSFVRPFLT